MYTLKRMDRLFVSIFNFILPVLKIQSLVESMLKYNKFFCAMSTPNFNASSWGVKKERVGFRIVSQAFQKCQHEPMMMTMIDDDDDFDG